MRKIEKDINAIALLLATQALINLGEIEDPVTKERRHDLDGARVFIDLVGVLQQKTAGNLTAGEEIFLGDLKENLDRVYEKRASIGNRT